MLCLLVLALAMAETPASSVKTTEGLEPEWLKTVVSIEVANLQGPQVLGTAFLVSTPEKHLLLVTAKHVVAPQGGVVPGLQYRFSLRAGGSRLVADSALDQRLPRA